MKASLITIFALVLMVLIVVGSVSLGSYIRTNNAYANISGPVYDFTNSIRDTADKFNWVGETGQKLLSDLGLMQTYRLQMYIMKIVENNGMGKYGYIWFWGDSDPNFRTSTKRYGQIYAIQNTGNTIEGSQYGELDILLDYPVPTYIGISNNFNNINDTLKYSNQIQAHDTKYYIYMSGGVWLDTQSFNDGIFNMTYTIESIEPFNMSEFNNYTNIKYLG